jgi:hypothetical protein
MTVYAGSRPVRASWTGRSPPGKAGGRWRARFVLEYQVNGTLLTTPKKSLVAVVFENPGFNAWRYQADGHPSYPNGWRSGNYTTPAAAEEAAKKRFPGCEVSRGEDPQSVLARARK